MRHARNAIKLAVRKSGGTLLRGDARLPRPDSQDHCPGRQLDNPLFIERDLTRIFEKAIAKGSRRTFALDAIRANPFKVGLFAMYADASLPRNDRQIFGNQMYYAFKHGVMPEHIVGFIKAAGSALDIARKLEANFREPGFSSDPGSMP